MRTPSFAHACALLFGLSLAAAPSAALGLGAIAVRPSAAAVVREGRVALSSGAGRSTLWLQVIVDGAADELLWAVPVPFGISVDVASDAFFDALEDATATRVRPPLSKPPSGSSCSVPVAAEVV